MTDPGEKEEVSSESLSAHTKNHLDLGSLPGSLPGSPDFLEMELQYAPVTESPTCNVHVTELSPAQEDRRKSRPASRFSSIVPIPPYAPRPQNHLCIAICGIICCVVPFGLIGLVCSLQVDSTYDDGDSESAEWKSSQAKAFSLAAIVIGMLVFLGGSFYVIFYHLIPAIT